MRLNLFGDRRLIVAMVFTTMITFAEAGVADDFVDSSGNVYPDNPFSGPAIGDPFQTEPEERMQGLSYIDLSASALLDMGAVYLITNDLEWKLWGPVLGYALPVIPTETQEQENEAIREGLWSPESEGPDADSSSVDSAQNILINPAVENTDEDSDDDYEDDWC